MTNETTETPNTKAEEFISWQIQQYTKIFSYIEGLLDFDNVIIELPPNHELNLKIKKGEQFSFRKIRLIELYKYTINKLDSDGNSNNFITELDVFALLKCIDNLLSEGDKIKLKIKDADQYISQANQGLLINLNQLQQKLVDFEKYKEENKEFNHLFKKMDEKFKDFIKKIDFDINEIKRKIDNVKKDEGVEDDEETIK